MDRFKRVLHERAECELYCRYDRPEPTSSAGQRRLRSSKQETRQLARASLKAAMRREYLDALDEAQLDQLDEQDAEMLRREEQDDAEEYARFLSGVDEDLNDEPDMCSDACPICNPPEEPLDPIDYDDWF